jgi:hypothetical protein
MHCASTPKVLPKLLLPLLLAAAVVVAVVVVGVVVVERETDAGTNRPTHLLVQIQVKNIITASSPDANQNIPTAFVVSMPVGSPSTAVPVLPVLLLLLLPPLPLPLHDENHEVQEEKALLHDVEA